MHTLPDFRVFQPQSIAEAIAARSNEPSSRYVGGGTDLIANLRRGLDDPKALIDLRGIPELRTLEASRNGLRIGGAVTLAELARHTAVRHHYPALVAAAEAVAAPAHREAATVAGNLCVDTRCRYFNESTWWRDAHGSCLKHRGDLCHLAPGGTRCWAAYSGDLAPALLVYEAQVDVAGSRGTFRMPLTGLFADDGAAHLTLAPDELIVSVILPADPWPALYAKVRIRGAIDFPLVGVAFAKRGRDVRVALTGTDSLPVLVETAFDDVERLIAMVGKLISPMRTTVVSPFYRRRVAAALVRRLATALS